MSGVPASSRSFNGGTITNPLVIDLSGDAADRTALDVIQPATFGFGVRPFRFRQTDFAYLQMDTSGDISSAGNPITSGGATIQTAGGRLLANASGGGAGHTFDPSATPTAGLFGHADVAQPTLVSATATPEQIALALQSYGAAGGT